jgi:outer membrane protein assembly factor BamB
MWDTEGSVACGFANQVYALDAASGGKVWEFWTGSLVYSSPAVVGGTVFVGSNDKKVRGADPPGRLTTAGGRTCMRLEKL